jgi:hypothetical protein
VPKKTAKLYEDLKQGAVTEGQATGSRAFTLRCKACDEESVYGIDEIQEFDGTQRVRKARFASARSVSYKAEDMRHHSI